MSRVASTPASLARAGDAERRPRVALTGPGKAGLLAGIVVLAAALNTANNLLYLFAGLMAVLYPLSWWAARAAVRRVEGELIVPRNLRAGAAGEAVVRLAHVRGRRGASALAVWVRGADEARRADFPHLDPEERASRRVLLRPARRGELELRAELVCPYPFGLLEARRDWGARSVLVLPRSVPPGRDARGGTGDGGEKIVLRKGRGAELLDIREYVVGEDARHLDWKATARLDTPMLREHAREGRRRIAVIVDPGLPRGLDRERAEDLVENAISRAAGALETLPEEGWEVRLLTPEGSVATGPVRQLEHLATLEYRGAPLEQRVWHARLEQGESWILFRARSEIPEPAP